MISCFVDLYVAILNSLVSAISFEGPDEPQNSEENCRNCTVWRTGGEAREIGGWLVPPSEEGNSSS